MYYCPYCHEQWRDDEGSWTCPKCHENDGIHSFTCVECNRDFECEEDSLPICDDCLEKVYTNMDSAIELADYEAEESGEEKPVNEFYTWLLGAEKVNEILHDYCKDVATEEDIRNFFMAGDTALLEDFLRKKFNV